VRFKIPTVCPIINNWLILQSINGSDQSIIGRGPADQSIKGWVSVPPLKLTRRICPSHFFYRNGQWLLRWRRSWFIAHLRVFYRSVVTICQRCEFILRGLWLVSWGTEPSLWLHHSLRAGDLPSLSQVAWIARFAFGLRCLDLSVAVGRSFLSQPISIVG
jgi:hypothetical protein